MNDTLKVAGRIGAELGAAKAEVERLRGLLEELHPYVRGCSSELWDRYLAALSAVTAERDRLAAENEQLKHVPAQELLERLVAQLKESGAENYQESCFGLQIGSKELEAFVTLRHAGKPGPHQLRMAAEAERDQLRAEVGRYVPLHEAVQRAADELPEGWAIQLYIERDGGGVELIGPDGTEDFATNNERLDYTVIDALEAAMAAKEA
ncbi:hypothetical protein [Stutzerimonas nitrititolerans]|uniref:hypothetical protein n=1 Tax=Stutzerimonas nitrititolerans TaxID=2482751 RepID=UPI0028AB2A08|nr:hypothetical protein [Stutzerimonas nitrititolerans]